jgi:hypothetical protein
MRVICPKCKTTATLSSTEAAETPLWICPRCQKAVLLEPAAEAEWVRPGDDEEVDTSTVSLYRVRRNRRYFLWLVLLFLTFLLYQWYQAFSSEQSLDQARDEVVIQALRQLATAQEAYWSGQNRYAQDVADLEGFRPSSQVDIQITAADGLHFEAVGRHVAMDSGLVWNSRVGGVLAERIVVH